MSSFIFESTACRQCTTGSPGCRSRQKRVLRTSTQDICCECGEVIQTFPETALVTASDAPNSLPAEVAATLATLLKQRLFMLARGRWPELVKPRWNEEEPKHRLGGQLVIKLRGRGNTDAEIRWSYSDAEQMRPYPWEEYDYPRSGTKVLRSHLKPKLADFDFAKPARVVRACRALTGFELTQGFTDQKRAAERHVRLEKRCAMPVWAVETVPNTVLVIKVQLSWIQVGSRFADETGPVVFYTKPWQEGFPMTLEEAINEQIFNAMWVGGRDYSGTLHLYHHEIHGAHEVARIVNPCHGRYAAERGDARCGRTILHLSEVQPKEHREDFFGPFKGEDGIYLVPAGEVRVNITVPSKPKDQQDPKLNGWDWVETHAVVLQGDTVLADQDNSGYPSGGTLHCSYGRANYPVMPSKSKFEAGETIVTRINDKGSDEVEEKTYRFVTWRDYHRAWEAYRAQFIDSYKAEVYAAVTSRVSTYITGRHVEPAPIAADAAVAAFVDGAWREGTYVALRPCSQVQGFVLPTHIVSITGASGTVEWQVAQCMPLEKALEAGLHVVPPYDASAPVGCQAIPSPGK